MKTFAYMSSLVLLLAGCASPSAVLVDPGGHKYRCATSGWGIIGAHMANEAFDKCVKDMEGQGYQVMSGDQSH